jgi:hypothetical protein
MFLVHDVELPKQVGIEMQLRALRNSRYKNWPLDAQLHEASQSAIG